MVDSLANNLNVVCVFNDFHVSIWHKYKFQKMNIIRLNTEHLQRPRVKYVFAWSTPKIN